MTTRKELLGLIDDLERSHDWHAHEMHRIDLEIALLRRELEQDAPAHRAASGKRSRQR